MLQNVQGTRPPLTLVLFRWRHTQGLAEIFLVNSAYLIRLATSSPIVSLNNNGDLIAKRKYL